MIKRLSIIFLFLLISLGVTSCTSQGVTSSYQKNEEIKKKTYTIDIKFEGGSGKAYIKSPVEITDVDGRLTARFVWSSKNYDYMIVNGIRYENENNGGESTFTVEIDNISEPLKVIGDTVAMSTPHEIEYLITWGEKGEVRTESIEAIETNREEVRKALSSSGLVKSETEALEYAAGFEIEKYGDYAYISIENSGDYLLVPKNKEVPDKLPKSVVILQKPLDRTYLVSTSAMDLINTCDALPMVKLSGTKESDWYIDAAKESMEKGELIYAGKYRAPDYELILQTGCNLAIENTMIYHEPAVKEKLTELGIPVLVETSSYERDPIGRLEWIKLYGVLFDREKEAKEYFDEQLGIIKPIMEKKADTGKTVAFFHVTANGMINVRKSGDYITKMIELAGGNYALTGAGEGDNALSSMNMQMEDFYAQAADADIIIYNSTIGGEISSIEELIGKNNLFKDFKAVKEKRVYCTERNLFQQITGMAEFMKDLNDVFMEKDRDYTYLNKLE
ncbi:ABC transporter substrate-binding protein [Butyrivibrio sp. AE3004]|uniref:ABC transporter substrate-binding protein n=1 Tax=Butyrivibrio sp. AE3004 TaxID=1506994 RepID=UPI00049404C6|nr:ABC transporter substrate-binding protein [Butyrivibrio sp. AE3004]